METTLNYKRSAFAQELLESIRCGNYTAGMRILSERDLSDKFSVSRNTVREGLSELFEMKILERRGRGAFVTHEALRIIENGKEISGTPARVMVLMSFNMHESPIFRTIFESIRSGLNGRAACEVFFSDMLPGAAAENVSANDIVLIFGESFDYDAIREIHQRCRQVILINAQSNVFNTIMPDNYAAGRSVAEYLYENGHKQIGAALCDPELPSEFNDRFRGARDFLREKNLDIMVEDIADKSDTFRIMQTFMDRFLSRKATAIICFQDIQAVMLYEAARRKKVRLPDDLSVVSFDDRCYTANCVPALSTVRYPAEAIGGAALHTILTVLEGKEPDMHTQIVPALLKRESVKKLI
ncbi:MAG: GntR family transcriptional regulator [Lentisphaerae bacterium]|nr:GntR family transcriptional regulator [Lentisphaerota bacterium]